MRNTLILTEMKGKTGMMITILRDNNYGIYDIHDIANVEKKIPTEWIDSENKQLKKEIIIELKVFIA